MVTATMTRDLWHRRSGARLPAGQASVRRADGARERTRARAVVLECFRCAERGELDADKAKRERVRRLTNVRVVAAGSTLGSTLLCPTCIGSLVPLDPDPLTVQAPG
jgi:hypothetical protein